MITFLLPRNGSGRFRPHRGGWIFSWNGFNTTRNPPIWVFSAETLTKVSETYQELNASSLAAYLPKFLLNNWFLWFPLWHWVAILLFIPLAFFLATLLTRLIASLFLVYFAPEFPSKRRPAGSRAYSVPSAFFSLRQ